MRKTEHICPRCLQGTIRSERKLNGKVDGKPACPDCVVKDIMYKALNRV